MNRRIFVKNTLIVSGGIMLSQSLINCVSNKLELNDLIGKSESLLDKSKKIGDTNFGYYHLSNFDYSHSEFKGNNIFIYCENQTIIGYTIQIKETKNFKDFKTQLSNTNGLEKKVYKNDFGEGFQWKTDNRKLTLEMTKEIPGIPSNIFFSESIVNNNLIVF